VLRHPERVKSLILANTVVPPRRLLWPAKAFLALLPLVPVGWMRRFRDRTLARAFSGVPSVPLEDQAYRADYQHALVSRLTKAELRAMYRLGID
jgi:pimeloyl-ACP methyl ester carboxylesterase